MAAVMNGELSLLSDITTRFGNSLLINTQTTSDGILTLWVRTDQLKVLLQFLKLEINKPFGLLYDLTAIDERRRMNRHNEPESDFTVVYHLTSIDRNEDIRIKAALTGEYPAAVSITEIWPSANWYEREIYDMFG